jgi:hypothetical protein
LRCGVGDDAGPAFAAGASPEAMIAHPHCRLSLPAGVDGEQRHASRLVQPRGVVSHEPIGTFPLVARSITAAISSEGVIFPRRKRLTMLRSRPMSSEKAASLTFSRSM